jgi:hypothetical protein
MVGPGQDWKVRRRELMIAQRFESLAGQVGHKGITKCTFGRKSKVKNARVLNSRANGLRVDGARGNARRIGSFLKCKKGLRAGEGDPRQRSVKE